MGASAYATVFYGVFLQKDQVLDRFGARFTKEVYDECPTDKQPNPSHQKFCGNCGTMLEYAKKTREGIESPNDIENLEEIKKAGLEVKILDEDSNGIDGILLGKESGGSGDILENGGVVILKDIGLNESEHIRKGLDGLGIIGPARNYLITSVSC